MSLAPSVAVPRAGFNPLPLYIGLFCLLWSFAFVAGKIGVTDCPPLILLTARFSLAGILILGITALRGEAWSSLTWRDAAIFAILGVANNALYLGLGYTGLQTVSAGLGGLIVSANPVFTAVLAAAFLGEALTWRKVMGLLLGIAGVGFIVWHRMSVGTDDWHGILFTLASLASIVAGTILFKVLAPKGSLWVGNGVQNLAAGIVLLPFAFTFSSVGDIVPSARLLGAFAFLVLGGSILAYLLWFHLLKVCGATAASAYHFLMPPLGMLFAFLVLGEHVEFRDLLGHRSGGARHLSGDPPRGVSVDQEECDMTLTITLIGGPTALIEIDGFRLLTDPTFDEPGAYQLPHVKLEKLTGPAMSARDVGAIDAVLLSHDQHSDNLDHSGREFLREAKRVLTTEAGAKRLGGKTEGFAPWASTELKKGGQSLTITATPARHGPAGIEPLSGDVIGFVVESSKAGSRPIYISGDTTWFDGVAEVAKRFKCGVVLPFAGAAQTRGPFHLTMDTNDTIETARAFADAVIVPVHTDGWAHFRQNAGDLRATFDTLGFGSRLRILQPGVATTIETVPA